MPINLPSNPTEGDEYTDAAALVWRSIPDVLWGSIRLPDSAGSGEPPTGSILPFASDASTPTDGYLPCDGAAVSRATYADLYTVIGDVYGAGDGSTTFNVPSCGDAVLAGVDTSNLLGSTKGNTSVVLGTDVVASHTHGATFDDVVGHVHGGGSFSSPFSSTIAGSVDSVGDHTHTYLGRQNPVYLVDGNGERYVYNNAMVATSSEPDHSHSISSNITASASGGTASVTPSAEHTPAAGVSESAGGTDPVPVIQPTIYLPFMIKT